MLMLAIAATGFYSAIHLPLELSPEVELPQLSIHTSWPDSSPESVEALVTAPIEAVAQTLPYVQKVTSESRDGQSKVEVAFAQHAPMDFITFELGEKLSLLAKDLPFGSSAPAIEKFVPKEFQTGEFLSYHFTGALPPYELRQYALQNLRGPLLGVEGVTAVEVWGGDERELQARIDRAKLESLHLSLAEVRQAFSALNLRQHVGKLYEQQSGIDVVLNNSIHSLEELARLPLAIGNRHIPLASICSLKVALVHPATLTRIDGKPAVMISIEREPGTNTIRVADAVFEKLPELEKQFPKDTRLIKQHDQSEQMRKDVADLSWRAGFGLLVVLLTLRLFLRNWRTAGIVLSTIFFAVLLTFDFFSVAGTGLNLITLAGFALGFGMLVDNAVVVVENIQRLRQNGMAAAEAAISGTREVAMPIIASTITTVVVFIPFLYMTGDLRAYYIPFAAAVSLSLLASLIVAFMFVPATARWLAAPLPSKPLARIYSFYKKSLTVCLRFRWPVIAATLILFAASLHIFLKKVTRGEIWKWGADTYIIVWANLPSGAQLERADEIARFFENRVVGQGGVQRVFTTVAPEYLRLHITFPDEVQLSAYPLILKEQLSVLASRFAGVSIGVYGFGPGFAIGAGGAAPSFRLQVLGYNYQEVKKFAEQIGRRIGSHPRVREVNTASAGWWAGEESHETVLQLDREKLSAYGLTVAGVMSQLSGYLREEIGYQQLKVENEQWNYKIKFADFVKFSEPDLFRVRLAGAGGQFVRLAEIAHIAEQPVQSIIARENQQYQRWIRFEFLGPYKLAQRYVDGILKSTHLPPGYRLMQPEWSWGERTSEVELWKIISLALLLVYMVTAALFESLWQPFIVIVAVPLALIGVFILFWLTDTNFDRSAYIGVVLMIGIVVNNSILLVDNMNRLRRSGLPLYEAAAQGAEQRLRPVLITSAAALAGLLPMIWGGETSGLWFSLALATIGGLSASTLLVLFVIPSLFTFSRKA
jgi:HAE1 family hydrophobic/amphiphilic exporter-1